MKKYLACLFVIASIGLCGCSSDNDEFGMHEQNSSENHSLETKNDAMTSNAGSSNFGAMTRGITSSSTVISHVGYTSCTKTKSVKFTVNSYMATYMGATAGVYIGKQATVLYRVDFSTDEVLKSVDSPDCGFKPLSGNKERGYVKKTEEDSYVEMATYCYYIEYSLSGMAINKWIPCAPEDVVWLYQIK